MSRFAAALSAALLVACSQPRPAPPPKEPFRSNGIKHAVLAVTAGAGLEGTALPQMFEQLLCTAMFELNEKQVVCAEEIRVLLQVQRERQTLSGEALNPEEVISRFDAPRRVSLTASKAGEKVLVSAAVLDRGDAAVAHLQTELKPDGSDLQDQAQALARQILSLR